MKRGHNASVLTWRDGKPVEWCYVVPEITVCKLLKRISKNPNSQTRRCLRELGIIREAKR